MTLAASRTSLGRSTLAQFAATGCFNGSFYTSAEAQLDTLKSLLAQVSDNTFLAKLALYSRERAFLKDLPAAIVATLAARDPRLFQLVFDRVIDNGRVLRTLFQMIRSGQFGKKSLSSSVQRAFQRWLNTALAGEIARGVDRQRSESARCAALGAADAGGQQPPRGVRLADGQAVGQVGTPRRLRTCRSSSRCWPSSARA
jgi:hypothetical protein